MSLLVLRVKLHNIWRFIENYFINTPTLMPDGRKYSV